MASGEKEVTKAGVGVVLEAGKVVLATTLVFEVIGVSMVMVVVDVLSLLDVPKANGDSVASLADACVLERTMGGVYTVGKGVSSAIGVGVGVDCGSDS